MVKPSRHVMAQVHHDYGRVIIDVLWETQQTITRSEPQAGIKLSVDHTLKYVPAPVHIAFIF